MGESEEASADHHFQRKLLEGDCRGRIGRRSRQGSDAGPLAAGFGPGRDHGDQTAAPATRSSAWQRGSDRPDRGWPRNRQSAVEPPPADRAYAHRDLRAGVVQGPRRGGTTGTCGLGRFRAQADRKTGYRSGVSPWQHGRQGFAARSPAARPEAARRSRRARTGSHGQRF